MHVGNAWTAWLAWLQVRSQGGRFVLRIEDIDLARARTEYIRQICDDLHWLGLDWDEGPDVGGPYGPYLQSERAALYEEAIAELSRQGRVYPCYCSRAELARIASAPHGLASEGPSYPGTCRRLTPADRAERARNKTPSLRFALPDEPALFRDEAIGEQVFPTGAGGDFVVKRADGVVAYQLAVVVDDAAMGITDVLRGRDLLDSTPRQLYLYEAFGWIAPPRFTHVPLLHDRDGERLSKRHRSLMLASLRQVGVRPETLIGYFAAMAGMIEAAEPLKAADLIGSFDLKKLPSAPVMPDLLLKF
jgi:glutamyl-tRNA synthetase